MKKRGQTTVFIVIAIAIVAIVLIVFYLNKSNSQTELADKLSQLGITTQASSVQSSIFNCLEETSKASLSVVGIQGGFYNTPERYFDLGWAFIPYYYDKGDFLNPTTDKIEEELGDFIDDNLGFCLEELPFEDFEISYENSNTIAKIDKKDVTFTIDSKIIIKKSELSTEYEISNFPVEIESSLSDILEISDYITESHKEDPDLICISCVADMAEIRRLVVDMIDFGGDDPTTLVVISENYTSSDPYIFEFLNRYPPVEFETI